MAKKVEMAKMPELVAFLHSMVGLAAVFIAIAAVIEPLALNITEKGMQIPAGNRLELFLGAAIGAITFSGSVIAFGKLSGKYKFRLFQGAPIASEFISGNAEFFDISTGQPCDIASKEVNPKTSQ